MSATSAAKALKTLEKPLRLAFVGTGWIGRHRMEAIISSNVAEATVICDPAPTVRTEAGRLVPEAVQVSSFEDVFDHELDGVVIATPSAQHAAQSLAALERGIPVFCQKPLGRNTAETKKVVDAARTADRLLGIDLSYRQTGGMQKVRELVAQGELGDVFAVDVVFHNAYGPDKSWFYDRDQSGGGCVIDLGVHLVDLALWVLDFPDILHAHSQLFQKGRPWGSQADGVEDAAWATLVLYNGTVIRLACSWGLHAGQDAVISCKFHGTKGGASFSNKGGSFYDFETRQLTGTSHRILHDEPEDWGGRAAVHWAKDLVQRPTFNPQAEELIKVAAALDRIYGRPI
ncbi:Gfo/Idh/MocA family oxidoreductase [Ciceribacter sp. L1K23]|uniref:Gfo/Idh/MocA family protein n=1 Tax=Ciceribacter sp. L1K23 TaxID=2820276 RepID=UPI001B818D62|nr:Gfo/Idh/MocA family oxidoreductase [Ciceribacter sp. L1K23]MBR0557072.1 Gfo/Idh/MocA family oxidoreductase [Ciceribacter sp. L1K23]